MLSTTWEKQLKLYRVRKGTEGKLISLSPSPTVRDWTVRKDLTFMHTITDPVRYHNRPDEVTNPTHLELVKQGYALFASSDNPNYVLAVSYNKVGVLA